MTAVDHAKVRASLQDGSYPRPQLLRQRWADLSGPWTFAIDDDHTGRASGWHTSTGFDRTIQVPFPPESAASGIGDPTPHSVFWYQREVTAAELGRGRPRTRTPPPAQLRGGRLPVRGLGRRHPGRRSHRRPHAVLARRHARPGRHRDPLDRRPGARRPARRRPAPRQAGLAGRAARHLVPPDLGDLAAGVARVGPARGRSCAALDDRPPPGERDRPDRAQRATVGRDTG